MISAVRLLRAMLCSRKSRKWGTGSQAITLQASPSSDQAQGHALRVVVQRRVLTVLELEERLRGLSVTVGHNRAAWPGLQGCRAAFSAWGAAGRAADLQPMLAA